MRERGVALYLAIMIMFILLAIGLGISTIIVSQMKMIRGMGDSVIAFYAADTGIDKTIFYDNKVIPSGGTRGLCYMNTSCPAPDCDWTCTGCGESGGDCGDTTCTDCTVIYESDLNGKRYDVEAVISGGATTIKSSGSYKGTKRAIEVVRLPPPKKVFVTSQRYTGELGGLFGADAICQTLADNATPVLTGTYKAWLSDGTTSATSRLTHHPGPYVRVDGVRIADNWDDLTDGALQNPIEITENGETPLLYFIVWTNTKIDGTVFSSLDHCSDWTTSSDSYWAAYGYFLETDSAWTTFASGGACSWVMRLYCFEQ